MESTLTLQELRQLPHLSASSINDYLDCGLSYRFRKVDYAKAEFVPAALIFGSCIHRILEEFHLSRQKRHLLSLERMLERFREIWDESTKDREDIVFKEGVTPDSQLNEGLRLLQAFYEQRPPDDFKVLGTEIPFSFEIEGVEIPIIGAIDLIEQDEQGNLIIVDHKTTSRAYSKQDIDKSLQLTLYYMAARDLGFQTDEILLRFDCLIKTKKPKFEQYYTVRSHEDEQRAKRKIQQVWNAIQKGVFVPQDGSWKCDGCVFRNRCDEWFLNPNERSDIR